MRRRRNRCHKQPNGYRCKARSLSTSKTGEVGTSIVGRQAFSPVHFFPGMIGTMDIPNTIDHFPAKKSKGFPWGCLIGGCLGVMGLGVLLVVGSGLGLYFYAKSELTKYTAETPRELPKIEYSQEELRSLTDRFESLQKSIQEAKTPDTLILTADDINGLIGQDENLKGRVYVKIADGKVSADVSFPADIVPGGQGRYFNGSVSANVSMENGVLIVTVADAEVNGERLPEIFLEPLRQENLAKDVDKNPENAEMLRRFESLTIENDRIILKTRAP